MLFLRSLFCALACALFISTHAYSASLSLNDALVKTYSHPSFEAARANLRAVEERKAQAMAGWKPNAYIEATRGKQDISRREFPDQKSWSNTQSLTATQPIFSGGGTIALMRQADAEIGVAREELRLIEQQLLLASITAFMNVLHAEELVEIAHNKSEVLTAYYHATERKLSLGEATKTDIAQAQARLSRATAEQIKAEGELATAKASFENSVGEKADVLVMPMTLPNLPTTEANELHNIAQTEHPSILRQRYAATAAEKAISVAKAKLLPALSLEASKIHSNESTTVTSNRQESDVGAIQMRLRVPLYQAGLEYSDIRQSRENSTKTKQELRATERTVMENLIKAREQWQSAKSNLIASRNSVEAATTAKEGMEREATVGARTALEILDSIQELFETQIMFSQAKREEQISTYTLLAQIGRLNHSSLNLPEGSF